MQQLLVVEGLAAGLPTGAEGISFRVDGRGDGGVDALVFTEPLTPTPHIKRRTVFQAKRSYDLSKLKSDLKKKSQQRARTLLQNGAGYTLIVCDQVDGEETARLRAALKELVGKSVPTTILSIEHVMQWLIQHPQLLINVPGFEDLVLHLRTFEQWESKYVEPLPWCPDSSRLTAIVRIENLEPGKHLRISGPAGVGKTRTVLEALRPRAAEVTYVPEFVTQAELLVSSATPVRGVLVVDECSTEQHRRLLRLHHSDVTLITIGVEENTEVVPSPDEVLLGQLSTESMFDLASRSGRQPYLQELARHSGGFPKFFALLLDATREAGVDALSKTSLSRRDVRTLLDRLLDRKGHLAALQALAAPLWVDLSDSSNDLDVLARATGVTKSQLKSAYVELKNRSLVGRLNARVYVTPQLLAEDLTLGFWGSPETARAQFKALGDAHAEPHFLARCIERLDGGSTESKKVLHALARDTRLMSRGLDQDQTVRMLERLIEIDTDAAMTAAEEFATSFTSHAARNFGRVLGQLAVHPEVFSRAVDQLVVFMRDEETDQLGLLTDLFAAAAVTQAPGPLRLNALDGLAVHRDERVRTLAVHCAAACCRERVGWSSGAHLFERLKGTRRREPLEYRSHGLALLVRLSRDDAPTVRALAAKLMTPLLDQLSSSEFHELGLAAARALSAGDGLLDEARAVLASVRRNDGYPFGDQRDEAIAEAERIFTPRSLAERVANEFALLRFGRDIEIRQPHVDALAAEVLATRDEATLALLFTRSRFGPVVFGQAMGRADSDASLLPDLLSRARRPGADLGFSIGYLMDFGREKLSPLLDLWSRDPTLARFVLEVTQRLLALDVNAALRLRSMVESGALQVAQLEALDVAYLRAPEDVRVVLRPLLQQVPPVWFACVRMGVDESSELSDELLDAWSAVAREESQHTSDFDHVTRLVSERAPDVFRRVFFELIPTERDVPYELNEHAGGLASNWREFSRFLELASDRTRARFRLIRGQFWSMKVDDVLAWVGDEEWRRVLIAWMAPPLTDSPTSVAAALLDAFPEDEAILSATSHNYPGVVSTGGLDAERGYLKNVRDFEHSPRRGLRAFSKYVVSSLERNVRREEAELHAEQHGIDSWRQPQKKISHAIFKLAESQSGYFSADQAKKSGCSAQLLRRYQQTGKVLRLRRSIYRLKEFPQSPYEDLMVLWLWSERRGVFSHSTALALHGLSSLMPTTYEMTMPSRHAKRRLRVPENLTLYFDDVPEAERVEFHSIWATSVKRTLVDCTTVGVDEDVLRDARDAARARGLS